MKTKSDLKLFLSLILWNLAPFIYSTVRLNLVTTSEADINILGQIEWFDLIDEILITGLITPLYLLLKDRKYKELAGTAFATAGVIYLVFSMIVYFSLKGLTEFMGAQDAETFLKLELVGLVFGFISTFCVLLLTLNGEHRSILILLVAKITISVFSDLLLIPNTGMYGSAYSDIAVNTVISLISIGICIHKKIVRKSKRLDHTFTKEWIRIGVFSSLQIFLDNFVYMVVVCRMVNAVSESGNYWMANSFIYGLLLVPLFQLAEIVKKNDLEKLTLKKYLEILHRSDGNTGIIFPVLEYTFFFPNRGTCAYGFHNRN